jgi:glucosamine-6-phosphate deaminase
MQPNYRQSADAKCKGVCVIKTFICNSYDEMSLRAVQLIAEGLSPHRENLISFPGGETPLGMFKTFVRLVNCGQIDISRTRYVSLDEWVGLGSEDIGSCAHFMYTNLLSKIEKPFLGYHIINGKAMDIDTECRTLDTFIESYGPLDVSVLGIGLNGHLGFNEDGVDFNLNAHIIPLAQTTKKVMHKYFDRSYNLNYGITQGLKQIMAAKRIIVIANGAHKAEILRRALHEPVSNSVPASILQHHPNCFVVTDREAAANL